MDPLAYCRDKSAPEGSANYYAVLFQPPEQRNAVLALLALEQELREVVEDCSELAVAEHKLAFWHEELARLLQGQHAHPVAAALASSAPAALDAELLQSLVEGVRARLSTRQLRDDDEVEVHCAATAGIIAQLMARALAPGDEPGARALHHAALATERLRLLRFPRCAGLPPHSTVPLAALSQAGVTPAEVDRGGTGEALVRLRHELLCAAHQRLEQARASLPSHRGLAATRLRIARAQAAALQRGEYVAAGIAREPLPIVLLWHAWRARPSAGAGV